MKNILTVYKFNFPFLFNNFEEMKYKAIVSDLKQLLLYNEIFKSTSQKNKKWYEKLSINFIWWKIEIIYYSNNDLYFIPQFQIDLFVTDSINSNLLEDVIKIFETVWLNEYIFNTIWYEEIYDIFDNILTVNSLEKNFKKYNYSSLEQFLKTTEKNYVDDRLNENKLIRDSFYYMIYLCFLCFKNSHDSEKNINEIEKLLWTKTFDLYKWNLELWKTRLSYLNELNLSYFKKYKLMLDKLFSLLK